MLQVTSVVPTNAGRLLFARLDSLTRARERSRRPAILGARAHLGDRRRGRRRRALRRGQAVRAARRRERGRPRGRRRRRSRATAWSSCCPPTPTWAAPAGRAASRSAARRAPTRCAPGSRSVPDDVDIVVVHDAARPLASRRLFDLVVQAVADGADGAVPALPVADTVKRVDGDRVVETVSREGLVGVQTPQAFRADALRAAHRRRRRRHRRRRARRGQRRRRGRGRGRAAQPEADARRRPRARAGAARRSAHERRA